VRSNTVALWLLADSVLARPRTQRQIEADTADLHLANGWHCLLRGSEQASMTPLGGPVTLLEKKKECCSVPAAGW